MAAAATTKERILEALCALPADATMDDALELLVFMARVEEGLTELDQGKGVAREEMKRRFGA
ncbi:MAG: hypothetical protein WEF50_04365 [Myxococcota bacterium]